MKNILRASLACLVISYTLLHTFKDFFLKEQIFGSALVIIGAITGLLFVIGMFLFWFKSKFANSFWKIAWLIVLLFSYYVIGPIIFYFVVFVRKPDAVRQGRVS